MYQTRSLQDWAKALWLALGHNRLGMVAGSLTFSTVLSLVPVALLGVGFFSILPGYLDVEESLRGWLFANLLPSNLRDQVLQGVDRFAAKANALSGLSLFFLSVSGISLVATIEAALNSIWGVDENRPWLQRIALYVFVLTLGPLLLGMSIAISGVAIDEVRVWLGLHLSEGKLLPTMKPAVGLLLLLCTVLLFYKYVPYTRVLWRQAALGTLVAVAAISLARNLLAWYFSQASFYATLYGAFATIPVLLLWIYTVWLLVLLGAVISTQVAGVGVRD